MQTNLGPTRTEIDFADHIEAVIAKAPKDGWIFISDQLNTHKSETLVRLVAKHYDLTIKLGDWTLDKSRDSKNMNCPKKGMMTWLIT